MRLLVVVMLVAVMLAVVLMVALVVLKAVLVVPAVSLVLLGVLAPMVLGEKIGPAMAVARVVRREVAA